MVEVSGHRPAVPGLHHADPGRHVGHDQLAEADAVSEDLAGTAAGRAESRLRGVRFEWPLRTAVAWPRRWASAPCGWPTTFPSCRSTCRIRVLCSITTAASFARDACGFAPNWKARMFGSSAPRGIHARDCQRSESRSGASGDLHELRQVRAGVSDWRTGGEGLGGRRDGQEESTTITSLVHRRGVQV